MKELMMFGKKYVIIEQNSDKDEVQLKDSRILIAGRKLTNSLLKGFLVEYLHAELLKIYKQIKDEGGVDLFGNLNFEIMEKIDNKRWRIAKLTGNKILVKLNAITLPKSALKYIIAHEIAHTLTRKHNQKFWKIVKTVYPSFERGQKLLMQYKPRAGGENGKNIGV